MNTIHYIIFAQIVFLIFMLGGLYFKIQQHRRRNKVLDDLHTVMKNVTQDLDQVGSILRQINFKLKGSSMIQKSGVTQLEMKPCYEKNDFWPILQAKAVPGRMHAAAENYGDIECPFCDHVITPEGSIIRVGQECLACHAKVVFIVPIREIRLYEKESSTERMEPE
jgi:hypothetical protein